MKTIITEKIEDYEIIIGFDKPVIDPVATKPKVNKILSECREAEQLIEAANNLRLKSINANSAEMAELKSKLKEAEDNINQKKRELMIANAVYFEPKKGEVIIDDIEATELTNKYRQLSQNQKLTRNGDIIDDYRNSNYCTKHNDKWVIGEIKKIGESLPKDSKLAAELTYDEKMGIKKQENENRIKKLSPSEKQKEKEQRLEAVLNKAAIIKSRYELEDDSEALPKAKAYLEDEKKKIEEKYA